MSSDVLQTWRDIEQWIQAHAAATAAKLAPVDLQAVSRVEAQFGAPLRDDVAAYLSAVLCSSRFPVFGLHATLDSDGMLGDSSMRSAISADVFVGESAGPVAGTPENIWSERFLAITSDHGGGALFVDLRDGAESGCVGTWDKVDGSMSYQSAVWPGVQALLADVLDSLQTGSPFMTYFVAAIQDGDLIWEFFEA